MLQKINRRLYCDLNFFDFVNYSLMRSRITQFLYFNEVNSDINYLSVDLKSPDDMISYLPSKKYKDVPDFDPMGDCVGRVALKIGRLVSKIIPKKHFEMGELNQSDVERFVNLYLSWRGMSKITLRVVEGEEIRKWYCEESYGRSYGGDGGTLWKSCMRHTKRQKFFDLYCQNPDKIKMLIGTQIQDGSEVLIGRALLWEEVENIKTGETFKFMDRIYTLNDSQMDNFKSWATQNGYIFKYQQSTKTELFFDIAGEMKRIRARVKLDKVNFNWYPYLDTFNFLCPYSKWITNDSDQPWEYHLIQADGRAVREQEPEEDYEGDEVW